MSTEPIELINKATGKLAAFACGKCHVVVSSPQMYTCGPEEAEALARQSAEVHCGPWFCSCGNERTDRHYPVCATCRNKQWAETLAAKEQALFDAAEKVDAADWTGEYLWDDGSEAIYSSPSELLDWYEGHEREPPTYAWDCDKHILRFSARDIIDRAVEEAEFHDGAGDVSDELVSLLDEQLDAWTQLADIVCWKPNGRAVLLPKRSEPT